MWEKCGCPYLLDDAGGVPDGVDGVDGAIRDPSAQQGFVLPGGDVEEGKGSGHELRGEIGERAHKYVVRLRHQYVPANPPPPSPCSSHCKIEIPLEKKSERGMEISHQQHFELTLLQWWLSGATERTPTGDSTPHNPEIGKREERGERESESGRERERGRERDRERERERENIYIYNG